MVEYKQLSEIEHILGRSSMYGAPNVIDSHDEIVIENNSVVVKNITRNELLLKIIDEIISNAVDSYYLQKSVPKQKRWLCLHQTTKNFITNYQNKMSKIFPT
jgi:hypothetical protein